MCKIVKDCSWENRDLGPNQWEFIKSSFHLNMILTDYSTASHHNKGIALGKQRGPNELDKTPLFTKT